MLAIGRAMMAEPKALLLDEPTLGLAPLIVQEIGGFVRRMAVSGLAVVLAEQNAEFALAVSDRVYVLQSGEAVIQGKAARTRRKSRNKKGVSWFITDDQDKAAGFLLLFLIKGDVS